MNRSLMLVLAGVAGCAGAPERGDAEATLTREASSVEQVGIARAGEPRRVVGDPRGAGARLRVLRWHSIEEGVEGSAAGMYDTQLGEACEPAIARDGSTRCLPADFALPAPGWFGDAGCTVALARVVNPGCGGRDPHYAWIGLLPDRCENVEALRYRVYKLGRQVVRPYRVTERGCEPQAVDPALGLRYHELGLEVEPAAFIGLDRTAL